MRCSLISKTLLLIGVFNILNLGGDGQGTEWVVFLLASSFFLDIMATYFERVLQCVPTNVQHVLGLE